MKKTAILILSLILSFASLFCVGCGGEEHNSEDIAGKYYFYATMEDVGSYGNKYGKLKKTGEEYESYYGKWMLRKESVVLEVFEDNTYRLELDYGDKGKAIIEGVWLKRVGTNLYYENSYELLNLTGSVYLDGNEIVFSSLPNYEWRVILKK